MNRGLLRGVPGPIDYVSLLASFDGSGVAIAASQTFDLPIDFTMQIVHWTLAGNVSGSMILDLWRDAGDNHPPTVADTIIGIGKPRLVTASRATGVPEGWRTILEQGDTLRVVTEGAATSITKATLALRCIRL